MGLLLPQRGVFPAVGDGGQPDTDPGQAHVWQHDLRIEDDSRGVG